MEQPSPPTIAVFQIFCSVLWMLDDYWKYTLFTLFMILSFEGTTALSRLKNMQQLRGMSAKGFSLHCYRDGAWVLVPSTSLLPSDIICLRRPAGAEPLTVPADCVVLRGGAVDCGGSRTGPSGRGANRAAVHARLSRRRRYVYRTTRTREWCVCVCARVSV